MFRTKNHGSVLSPAGKHRPDPVVGHEHAVELGVVALGGAHAERVPRRHDLVARIVAVHEAVDDDRVGRVGRVHRVHPEPGPHRAQRAEVLVAVELVAALDTLGTRGRQGDRDVVAGLGVTGREDVTGCHVMQHPVAGRVAEAVQLSGHTDPVEVHAGGERGRGCVPGQAALQLSELHEAHVPTTEVGGHRRGQVAERGQLLEVLVEERVGAVVSSGPSPEPLEQFIGQDRIGGRSIGDGHWWSFRRLLARRFRVAAGIALARGWRETPAACERHRPRCDHDPHHDIRRDIRRAHGLPARHRSALDRPDGGRPGAHVRPLVSAARCHRSRGGDGGRRGALRRAVRAGRPRPRSRWHVRDRTPRSPPARSLPRRADPGRVRRRRRDLDPRRAGRHVAARARRRGDHDRREHALGGDPQHLSSAAGGDHPR